MMPLIDWLIGVGAGFLLSSQMLHPFKVANEDEQSHIMFRMDTSAIQMAAEQPYIMGSEQISAVLQQILSSDQNDLERHPVFVGRDVHGNNSDKSEFVLGSESLNRMLEEMLAAPCSDNTKLPHIEPAMQL